jgi:hypothetical protein
MITPATPKKRRAHHEAHEAAHLGRPQDAGDEHVEGDVGEQQDQLLGGGVRLVELLQDRQVQRDAGDGGDREEHEQRVEDPDAVRDPRPAHRLLDGEHEQPGDEAAEQEEAVRARIERQRDAERDRVDRHRVDHHHQQRGEPRQDAGRAGPVPARSARPRDTERLRVRGH